MEIFYLTTNSTHFILHLYGMGRDSLYAIFYTHDIHTKTFVIPVIETWQEYKIAHLAHSRRP